MTTVPYDIEPDTRPAIGLIVLQADETIEDEMRALLPSDIRLLVSRVPSGLSVTPETLSEMAGHLTAAATLFPRGMRFDAFGYACTSGAAEIGRERVAELIRQGACAKRVTDPVTALIAACRDMGVKRIGLVSPYVAEVSDRLIGVLAGEGIEVTARVTFDEAEEARVARISADSVRQAARQVMSQASPEAVFLSCTNLRTATILDDLTAELGCPVMSSNSVLAGHLSAICRPPR
ncbi:Asp/Glu racemase [Alphaproteobacteria bacterium GH1-50]|uniref:Asp/Glu racemase n=1 Tax=Kangsaoukella pontilimi TaxID=2691042 RepID=A0A7C9IQU1_9RHOB|nr:Asp/Glu racemase [Kangsaoukella pontilimi]MXQ09690.1 Asp/Glu racemase [Kangsaoukella pontilimi]